MYYRLPGNDIRSANCDVRTKIVRAQHHELQSSPSKGQWPSIIVVRGRVVRVGTVEPDEHLTSTPAQADNCGGDLE
jgi:hypothetical protein